MHFIKMILVSLRRREITLEVFWKGYGNKAGMPSSHTAFMASATTAIYILDGGVTNLFMLSLITTLIIIQSVVDLKFHAMSMALRTVRTIVRTRSVSPPHQV